MKFKNWISPSYKIYPEIRKIIWPVAAHKGMYLREPSQFSVTHFKSAKSISLSSFFLSVSMTAFSTSAMAAMASALETPAPGLWLSTATDGEPLTGSGDLIQPGLGSKVMIPASQALTTKTELELRARLLIQGGVSQACRHAAHPRGSTGAVWADSSGPTSEGEGKGKNAVRPCH